MLVFACLFPCKGLKGLASNVSRLKDSTTWGLVNSADSDHPRLNKGRKYVEFKWIPPKFAVFRQFLVIMFGCILVGCGSQQPLRF